MPIDYKLLTFSVPAIKYVVKQRVGSVPSFLLLTSYAVAITKRNW